MNARSAVGRLLVALALLAIVGGCAAGASHSQTPASSSPADSPSTAVATPTKAPTPSPTTAPSGPISYGPVSVVSGISTCAYVDLPVTTDANGTQHVRGGTASCTNTTDDPRVSGWHTAPGTLGLDVWGVLDALDFSLAQWATVRLENAGGAWEGRLSGVATLPGRGDIITIWYRGTGDYAGLTFFELDTGKGGSWTIQGQVFPGDPPPPYSAEGRGIERPEVAGPVADDAVAVVEGAAICPGMSFDFTTDPDGTMHVRGDYHAGRCTLTTDDPRVSGLRSSTWNIDLWGNPDAGQWALVQWGTQRLENAAGAWEGRATGVGSSDRGDFIVNWYKGTGDYAGLSYFELWTGQEPWKIQGQIFPGDPPTP
jgi:hypothetical protein